MTTTRLLRLPIALVLATATALAATSCAAPPGRGGAGAPPAPALRSLYGNGPGSVGADALRALLEDRSSPIRLEDVTDALDAGPTDDSDGAAVAALRAGRADVAVIRAGRLAQAGARSLLAVQAPMAITNGTQAARAAADPAVLRALDGLRSIGLVGLALVPGGERHPFGYRTALTAVDQFSGSTINSRPDASVDAMLAALGAEPDHSVNAARSTGAASGRLRGIEVAFGQQSAVDRPAVVTSNLVLYEKFDVIVMRAKAYDALDAATAKALVSRAAADAAAAVAARESEAEGLARWCSERGVASVTVSAATIAAFRAKLAPVVATLRGDAASAAVLDRIAELHAGTTDPVGTTCTGAPPAAPDDASTLEPSGSQSVLDGRWRIDVSADELQAAGASLQDARNNAGVWTYTIRDGLAQAAQPTGDPCTVRFTISEHDVLADFGAEGDDGCTGLARGTFTVVDDKIRFHWTAERDYPVALDQVGLGTLSKVGG